MSVAITVIHEPTSAEPFVVLSKPAGLPSAPLAVGDACALTECARLFPETMNVHGKKAVEGGLVHRIDTSTSGLLLVAASQGFYDHIIAAQEKGLFVKGYRSESDINAKNAQTLGGFPTLGKQAQKAADFLYCDKSLSALCGLELSSFFRPFAKGKKEVRPVLQNSNSAALKKIGSAEIYSTKIVAADFLGDGSLKVECKITNGYRHQVRCHLAWLGLPARGDRIYNSFCRTQGAALQSAIAGEMRFFATSLEFPDLFSEKTFCFFLD